MTQAMDGVQSKLAIELQGPASADREQAHRTCRDEAERRRVLDITVLMGGPSSEREVSLLSGAAIADGLSRCGHTVTRSDISPSNLAALDRPGIDVVFIALHGQFGESGDVQRLCEQRGLRYIGSPPQASELAMDKWASKAVFQAAGVTTPEGVLVTGLAGNGKRALESLGLPVVLKPVDGGSSVDVTIAHSAAQRDAAATSLLGTYGQFLAEQFIPGRELTVSILGEQPLPVIEIVPDGAFYDYRAKYSDDAATQYLFDHNLAPETVATLQSQALAAHKALGCRDLSRVDFILTDASQGYVLEINTIPGFTSHSLLPKAAARIGVTFDELVNTIANMAMERETTAATSHKPQATR